MSIVDDFKSINSRLRGDDWWEPAVTAVATPSAKCDHSYSEYDFRCTQCGEPEQNLAAPAAPVACEPVESKPRYQDPRGGSGRLDDTKPELLRTAYEDDRGRIWARDPSLGWFCDGAYVDGGPSASGAKSVRRLNQAWWVPAENV